MIQLTVNQINQILSVLAQLPNSSMTYSLMTEIKETAEQQLNVVTTTNESV